MYGFSGRAACRVLKFIELRVQFLCGHLTGVGGKGSGFRAQFLARAFAGNGWRSGEIIVRVYYKADILLMEEILHQLKSLKS